MLGLKKCQLESVILFWYELIEISWGNMKVREIESSVGRDIIRNPTFG